MKIKPFIVHLIERCARCGKNHTKIRFRPFKRKNPAYTHWALCPTNGEPILMIVQETQEPVSVSKLKFTSKSLNFSVDPNKQQYK